MEKLKNVHITSTARKFYFNLLGAMAKSIPTKFGPYLKQLAPFVISELSQQEVDERMEEDEEQDYSGDEMREAAITALESFYASCAGYVLNLFFHCSCLFLLDRLSVGKVL